MPKTSCRGNRDSPVSISTPHSPPSGRNDDQGRIKESSINNFLSAINNNNTDAQLKKNDALNLLNELTSSNNKADLIVTDPPYGFNVKYKALSEAGETMELYAEMIKSMVKALAPNGQIVLCLPDHALNGQSIPWFETQELVKRQILVAAENEGLEVIQEASSRPSPAALFLPPYYWNSEKKLSRSILHFRFKGNSCNTASTELNSA